MKSRGGLKHYGVKMLLELRLENFKNFKEFTVFSMVPQPEIRNLKYSVLKRKISGTREPQKALCSSVIFGPNASGKSNLIIAVEILKRIVLRGNILDDESVNFSASSLSLAPNSFLGKNTPVYIGISFITGELKIDYDLILALGGFLGNSIDRCVIGEKLSVNEKPVFDRKERHIELYNHPIMKEKFKVKGYKDLIIQLINEGLQPTDVFLSNGFKCLVSPELSNLILAWFRNSLTIHYCRDEANNFSELIKSNSGNIFENINKIANAIGITSHSFYFKELWRNENKTLLQSLVKDLKGNLRSIDSETYESKGTLRLMFLVPIVLEALKKGSILFIDELEVSIHPMVIMNLVNIFHNDEINKNRAQIIFTSNNPSLMNDNLFRLDEIKFIDRDKGGSSVVYSLSEIENNGERKNINPIGYCKDYLLGKYGSIPTNNFDDLFFFRN